MKLAKLLKVADKVAADDLKYQSSNIYLYHTFDNDEVAVDLGDMDYKEADDKLKELMGETSYELRDLPMLTFEELVKEIETKYI